MPNQALIFGSTGLIGTQLLNELAARGSSGPEQKVFDFVTLLNRRPHPDQDLIRENDHITEQLFDFKDWSTLDHHFTPQTSVFICIGTTRKKTPDKKQYQYIDRDIPVAIAEASHKGGCSSIQVVSAVGADAASKVFYNRTKGEMEEGIKKAFPGGNVVFYRPGLLLGNRGESR